MGKTRITLLLALGATLMAGAPEPAPLPGEAPKPPAEASATVTVSAEVLPVELVKTPSTVKILDKAAIEASGARTLGDLLENLFPGQLLSNGGVGTAGSFNLGGARSQDTVVTLDGIRLTDSTSLGGLNTSTLSLAGIERIEVQVGPCTSRFGSEAVGGVVALSSAGSAPAGLSGEAKLAAGTQGILQGTFAPAYGWKGGWVRAALQGSRENQATSTDNPFRTSGVFVGAGQTLGEDTLVSVSYRNAYAGSPIPYLRPELTPRVYDPSRESLMRSEQIIGTLRTLFTPKLMGELTLGQALHSRQEPGHSLYDSRRNQAVGHLAWIPMAGFGLNASVDAYEEHASVPGYPAPKDRAEGRHIGADLEANWEPFADLRLVGSVRQQWDHQNYVLQAGAKGIPESRTDKTTWKAGVNYLLGKGFRLYASGGTAYSLPILYAVIYNSTNPGGKPLGNEESSFIRMGGGWEQGPWSARVEVSRTNYSQLTYFDMNTWLYGNGTQMRLQSVEGTFGYRTSAWGAEGFWRNQEARAMGSAPDQQLRDGGVIRRPFNTLGAKGFLVSGAWRMDARWSWTGPRYENFETRIAASKVHFNDLAVGATWSATPALSLSLRGEHLLQPRISAADWVKRLNDGENDAYQIYGFPAQPPTATLELRYRF